MYIKGLQVDGYGALRDVRLEIGPDGVAEPRVFVVYGPNEAGKSTLLRFVRSMLYGFPTRKEPAERGEPVNGGRHGGRLLLVDRAGREWLVERHAERSGEVRLRDGDGNERTLSQAEWERLMLGGVPERLFRQLFAVSLNELHELRTLQGNELGDYLYHAGLAGGKAVTEARRALGTELDKLYRPKGTTQEMNRLLAELKELDAEIRRSGDAVRDYLETGEALAEAEARLAATEGLLPELRLEVAKLEGARDLREWWLRREALLAEEAALRERLPRPEAPPLPPEARAEWESLLAKRDGAAGRLRSAGSALAALRAERSRLAWEEDKISALPELELLEATREGIAAKREEKAELESERRTLRDAVRNALAGISADWTESDLAAFGGLAAERDRARRLQASWEEADRALQSLRAETRRLDRQEEALFGEGEGDASEDGLADREREISRAEANVGGELGFVPLAKPELLRAWNRAEDARTEFERASASSGSVTVEDGFAGAARASGRRSSARGRPGGGRSSAYGLAALAAACGGLLLAIRFAAGDVPLETYGIALLLFALAAGAIIRANRKAAAATSRQGGPGPDPGAEARRNAARARLNESLGGLVRNSEAAAARMFADEAGASGPEADEAWRKLREAVQAELDRMEASERATSKAREWRARLQELRKEKELLAADAREQAARFEEIREAWRIWLSESKLPERLDPRSLPELLSAAERGQEALGREKRLGERIRALETSIARYDEAAAALADRWALPAARRLDPGLAAQAMCREAEAQLSAKKEAGEADRRIGEAEAEVSAAEAELAAFGEKIAERLVSAGEPDESGMETRLLVDDGCRALRKEIREIGLRLDSGRDGEAREELYALLRGNDESSLAARLEARASELSVREREREELLDRRGRLAQQLQKLGEEAEREDRRGRRGELEARLEELAERYAVLAIADTLISRTKAAYEEEKQPEVLLRASRFFRAMTGGAYERIVAPGDTKELFAETADRRLVNSLFLSRGTQEQMYLAMRFALSEAASPDAPLPLLLDDLFVHFDESRLEATMPVLGELARTRQVFLFTCHRRAADAVVGGVAGARLVTLGV